MNGTVTELEEATADQTGPSPTDLDIGQVLIQVDRGIERYLERCRKRVPSFVSANFSLEETWRLQRPTLWVDLAIAPINSGWALPRLALHKVAVSAERVGYPQLARWAGRLPAGIKTGYQRQLERRICLELLEWDRVRSPSALPQGLLQELDAVPALRERIDALELGRGDQAPVRTLVEMLNHFSAGRAIISDLLGTLLTLAMSWAVLGSASLSLSNIAHGVARRRAHDRAASRFFLGKKLGSAFYSVFPPKVEEGTVWTIVVLLAVGLTVVAMACTILSDPVRKFLGLHRNRLELLLDEMERELIVLSHKTIRQRFQRDASGSALTL